MINFDNSKSPKILVVGDLMIDQYLWGSSEKISPEAPVPVININQDNEVLGGAGNVVNNLKKWVVSHLFSNGSFWSVPTIDFCVFR